MKATSIIWRRTFPKSEPGTDGVAIFEGGRQSVRNARIGEKKREPCLSAW